MHASNREVNNVGRLPRKHLFSQIWNEWNSRKEFLRSWRFKPSPRIGPHETMQALVLTGSEALYILHFGDLSICSLLLSPNKTQGDS